MRFWCYCYYFEFPGAAKKELKAEMETELRVLLIFLAREERVRGEDTLKL